MTGEKPGRCRGCDGGGQRRSAVWGKSPGQRTNLSAPSAFNATPKILNLSPPIVSPTGPAKSVARVLVPTRQNTWPRISPLFRSLYACCLPSPAASSMHRRKVARRCLTCEKSRWGGVLSSAWRSLVLVLTVQSETPPAATTSTSMHLIISEEHRQRISTPDAERTLFVKKIGAGEISCLLATHPLTMPRSPLFTTLARGPSRALSCRWLGWKELFLLFAVALWSVALLEVPKQISKAQGKGSNAWNDEVGKPRVIMAPEVELAADCAARRGGPVLVIEALTSDEWALLSAEDFEARYIRVSKPVGKLPPQKYEYQPLHCTFTLNP